MSTSPPQADRSEVVGDRLLAALRRWSQHGDGWLQVTARVTRGTVRECCLLSCLLTYSTSTLPQRNHVEAEKLVPRPALEDERRVWVSALALSIERGERVPCRLSGHVRVAPDAREPLPRRARVVRRVCATVWPMVVREEQRLV